MYAYLNSIILSTYHMNLVYPATRRCIAICVYYAVDLLDPWGVASEVVQRLPGMASDSLRGFCTNMLRLVMLKPGRYHRCVCFKTGQLRVQQ